ncbi:MAG: competence/damage-inducible protein A [Alphaproteobacteria bacterium]|nr:competence/damage-inducible protein A [Alphaproteobacteria bacterium]
MINACLLIIGNEILSGRTQDKNLAWIAAQLNETGIKLAEVRVIPDVEATVVGALNECRKNFNYVFTTGGIGPTHDDITSACVAKAFGVAIERNAEAEALLEKHYTREQLNEARLKMAEIPVGASLIYNPVSAAPGFRIENVFVMAGVPRIMQAMFDGIKNELKGGEKTHSRTVAAYVTEGVIAAELTAIAEHFANVDIGSYPFIRNQRLGTTLIARSTDTAALDLAQAELKKMLLSFTDEVVDEDLASA